MKKANGKDLLVRKSLRAVTIYIIIVLSISSSVAAQAATVDKMGALPNGLRVGKWMLQSDGQTVANYLGKTYSEYDNKKIQEMINFIYEDSYATSSQNANDRFYAAIHNASPSFSRSKMHSGEYTSYLQNRLFKQKPDNGYTAYVDKSWFHQNLHHFRTFGAVYYQKAWYITAAASTEDYNWLNFTHTFNSFNTARDVLMEALLNSQTDPGFKRLPNVDLCNKIPKNDANLTTADFDGITMYVQAPTEIHMG